MKIGINIIPTNGARSDDAIDSGRLSKQERIEFETTVFVVSNNKHNHVDDYAFGGGAGMLLKVEPIDLARRFERSPETTPC